MHLETAPSLRTDHYELTMLASAIDEGIVDAPVAFALFARSLPEGRRYGQLAGLGRFLDQLARFTFDTDDLLWLRESGVIDQATADWLTGWRFAGDIEAYPEGELYMPGSPVLVVRGRLGDCLLLETLALSIFNHDTAVMSKAARIVDAAGGTPIIEMGSRRTHEAAATDAARAAYLAGFTATSNLAAGRLHAVPTTGTAAHAWTLAHAADGEDGELAAFAAQIEALGVDTTLLVDTFDITRGIARAVQAARDAGADGPGAIRIDSGDLLDESRRARALLDELGATATRIVVSGDMDEYAITRLRDAGAPIDGYGVGTRVVAGLTPPGFVYKLVEVHSAAVSKRSSSKHSPHGVRDAWRTHDANGHVTDELLVAAGAPAPVPGARRVREAVVVAGRILPTPLTDQVRDVALAARARLRPIDRRVEDVAAAPAFAVHDLTTRPVAQSAESDQPAVGEMEAGTAAIQTATTPERTNAAGGAYRGPCANCGATITGAKGDYFHTDDLAVACPDGADIATPTTRTASAA